MGEHLGVAKAAALLGISRRELQQLIRRGELHTFEGELDLDELRQNYPLIDLEDDSMLERVRLLRKTAFGRRLKDTILPDSDELSGRLRRKMAELDITREQMIHYRDLLQDLTKLLRQMEQKEDAVTREVVSRINSWLSDRIKV